jgi:hypothetical protein
MGVEETSISCREVQRSKGPIKTYHAQAEKVHWHHDGKGMFPTAATMVTDSRKHSALSSSHR